MYASQEGTGLVVLDYWLGFKCGVTYDVCHSGAETLDSAPTGVVLEWVDCCGGIVCIFVRMEVAEKDYWCV